MTKTIVICCDGTWVGPANDTNIWRTFSLLNRAIGRSEAIQPVAGKPAVVSGRTLDTDEEMVLFYDVGVGAEPRNRFLGGGLGRGLTRNIAEAYGFLVEVWEPGDRIFCFGFSRGAFTVRALCGVIGAAGLVTASLPSNIERAVAYYRTPPSARSAAMLAGIERRSGSIRFLGVYDTVGALGVVAPRLAFFNRLFGRRLGFHDVRLGNRVEVACQAMAIDERRGAFKPVVWSRAPGVALRFDNHPVPQTVHQVWFAGAHGNVGGGLSDDDLSRLPFHWMLRRAIEAGLPLERRLLDREHKGDPKGPRHDSARTLVGRLTSGDEGSDRPLAASLPLAMGWIVRLAGAVLRLIEVPPNDRQIGGEQHHDDGTWSIPVGEAIHESVRARFARGLVPPKLARASEAGVPVFEEPIERPSVGGEPPIRIVTSA